MTRLSKRLLQERRPPFLPSPGLPLKPQALLLGSCVPPACAFLAPSPWLQCLRRARSGLALGALVLPALLLAAAGCEDDTSFVRAYQMETMAQAIGGPAAAARPGDYMLENNRLRAVIHGRHNQRSTFPIANGSLVDLDIQRPAGKSRLGRGKDAFYEFGPMVNLKINSSRAMAFGACDKVGDAPCPKPGCQRVTATGPAENVMSLLALLDLAILRETFDNAKMWMTTDYDLCPDEPFVRMTTSARFEEKPTKTVDMEELNRSTGLLDVLLGESTGQTCAEDKECKAGETCEKLLLEIPLGGFTIKMRRCRTSSQKLSGVIAGDLALFSAKVNVFVPGGGFDHESYIRSVFDAGGDTFSNPLTASYMTAVADGVSYSYFNETGKSMIPVFTEAFTATFTNRFACDRNDKECFKGKAIRFKRYVGVGHGDVASALEGFYQLRNIPTAQVNGHVLDGRDRKPLSGVDVFVYKMPAAWQKLSDEALANNLKESTDKSLEAILRSESATSMNPFGEPGVISHFKTDVGLDSTADGSFGGLLPFHKEWCDVAGKCRYILFARPHGRDPSRLIPVTVAAGDEIPVTLMTGEQGTLQFIIKDQGGQRIPSKITVGRCFAECAVNSDCPAALPVCDLDPKDAVASAMDDQDRHGICIPAKGYTQASDCRPDQEWDMARQVCICPSHGLLPLSQGGHRLADGTINVHLSASGSGELHLEPGHYQVVASRGMEYGIHRQFITLDGGAVTRMAATLSKVVDTSDWISGDFHVHGPNSVDASASFEKRIKSMVAEGVELFAATDHDYLTDYMPHITQMGLASWLMSVTGTEVSPLDYGHFIGFPLVYDHTAEQNGGFHWRKNKSANSYTGNEEDFEHVAPGDIFKKLRDMGSLGPDGTLVFVSHFYDHFTNYSMDPWTLELPFDPFEPVGKLFNDVLKGTNFSGEFDALEGFNGKGMDIIRRPTYKEVRDYNAQLDALIKKSANWSYHRRMRAWGRLSAGAQREFMKRTEAEQKLAINYSNSNFSCRCSLDSECGDMGLCDELTGGCVPKTKATRCKTDSECSAALVSAGREKCQTVATSITGGTFCRRLAGTCTKDTDCTAVFGKDTNGKDITETCISGTCGFACTADSTCYNDPLASVCDKSKGICTMFSVATAVDPCPQMRGTVDDWFQMLNHGIIRPFIGNSDTHGTYGTESGIPRNYVKSDTDKPRAIDIGRVTKNIKDMKLFTTYGPFVELTLNGEETSNTVRSLPKGSTVRLKLKIQSPLWFDVDRIEVYKNGQLIKVISGKQDCAPADASCIQAPNKQVVNYDNTITDTVDKDAWYVVTVMGLDGKSLAPVYSSTPVARLGMFELIQRLTPLLPPLVSFRVPLAPSMTTVRPYAMTNPIFVDADGDEKITPLSSLPNWATKDDEKWIPKSSTTSTSSASSASDGNQGPAGANSSHDHRNGLGRMVLDARKFQSLVKEGKITPDMLSGAMNSLRYMGSGY